MMGFDTMHNYEKLMVSSVLRTVPETEDAENFRLRRKDSCMFDTSSRGQPNRTIMRQHRPSSLSPGIPSFQATKSRWSPPASPGSISPRSRISNPTLPSGMAKTESDLAKDLFADACAGDVAGMQIALSQGASVNCSVLVPGVFEAFTPAKPGQLSPLAGAASYGKLDAVKFLLASGAEINPCTSRSASSPLHQACRSNSIEIVRLLLEQGADVNIGNAYKTTPTMYAVKYSSLEIISLLVSYRPDLELLSFIGSTAMHWAVWPGKAEVAELLLRARADPNQPAPDGNTALHYAVTTGSASMVKCLLRYGADPLRRNEAYVTPLQLAEEMADGRNEQIIAMLNTVIGMTRRR